MNMIIGIIIGICLCQANDRFKLIKKAKDFIKKIRK
jgi:hypothetical protein